MKSKSKNPKWLTTDLSKTPDNAPLLPMENKVMKPKTDLAFDSLPWSQISKAETLEQFKQEVGEAAQIADLTRIKKLDDLINELLRYLSDPKKLEDSKPRDLAVVLGILVDKRQSAIDANLQRQKSSNLQLRVAWQGGSGAIEIKDKGGD